MRPEDESFDMIFHPVSNCYVKDVLSIWKECYRILKRNGELLAGFDHYINYLVSGNPFQYLEYQSVHWHQNLGFFFSTAAYQTDYALSAARSHDLPSLLGLWLPNLICALSSLPLVALASRKLRASWLLWFMAYYIIAIGPTWLLSAPRYLLALPPLPLAMALFCRDSRRNQALSLLLGDFSFFYLIAFSLRWQVW